MNAFGLDIESLDSDLIKEIVSDAVNLVDWLPGLPAILSREDCALLASVSIPTIERLIRDGELQEVLVSGADSGILKSDLIAYIKRSFLVDKPLLG